MGNECIFCLPSKVTCFDSFAEEPDVRTRKIVKVVTQTMVNGKVVDESSEVEQIEERKKWAKQKEQQCNVVIYIDLNIYIQRAWGLWMISDLYVLLSSCFNELQKKKSMTNMLRFIQCGVCVSSTTGFCLVNKVQREKMMNVSSNLCELQEETHYREML